jgi:hypothetical protein
MARDGLDVDSSTLWEQTSFLSQHLLPTYVANHAHVLSADVIAVDETWWRLIENGGSKRRWVWSVAREDAVSYRLLSSRSTHAARTVLDDYTGVAICDGYKVYDLLAREREGSDLTLAHCWAHVGRRFVEPEPHYREAGTIIDQIRTALCDRGRALRGVAAGRKNHYGSRSERGTRTAALLCSLIESAKLCRVEPRAHLREATPQAVRDPGAVTLPRALKSPQF